MTWFGMVWLGPRSIETTDIALFKEIHILNSTINTFVYTLSLKLSIIPIYYYCFIYFKDEKTKTLNG